MTKRAFSMPPEPPRSYKLCMYVRERVDLISQPKAIKAFGFGF